MRITVISNDEIGVRVAHVLAALDRQHEVSLYGATESKVFPIVKDFTGAETVITDGHTEVPADGYRIISPDLDPRADVWGCAPVGLALALSAKLDQVEQIAACQQLPDLPAADDGYVSFPDPVGKRRTGTVEVAGRTVRIAAPINKWSAVRVDGKPKSLGTVDDTRFLRSVTLAAGVGLEGGQTPWDRPDEYLETCRKAGLVFAQAD